MSSENNDRQEQMPLTAAELSEQEAIRREKLKELQDAGKDPFVITTFPQDTHSVKIQDNFDSLEGKPVAVAGRIMTKRIMGKASFAHVADRHGQIQVYIKGEDVGEESYADFKKMDIGDIIGIKGEVFKTQKGEVSVKAKEVILLTKSLRVLPEKFHGLRDQELRYRQRYVDLIVNPEVKDVFLKRTAIIKSIRRFLDDRDYIEVETPTLQVIPGGTLARPFKTHHNTLDLDMYLRIALELPLKKLIVGGFERVYEIGRNFRNEGMSTRHNPEFTMLELYEAYTDYNGMMELIESMMRKVAMDVNGTLKLEYGEYTIDLEKPFEKLTMVDAVKKYANVDFDEIKTLEEARAVAKKHHIEYAERHAKGDILNLFFDRYAEENLIQPTFIIDYPVEISFLTKRKPDKPEYTERFELFITAREFANAYSELNDPIDQRERFEHQARMKSMGDVEASDIDEDFMAAMEYGMAPTGGLGLGVDRFVMLLTNAQSIRDVLLFPTMKPVE
ncbi:MAG: lysine--tRNA ligase [Defluviitaleaceae bacterium]|nr:lysine--tRNA ligase [Defluviitaleaceae bacterium]